MEMTWLPCLMMFSFLILSEGRTIKKRGKFCHYDGTNFEEGNEIITHDRCETCKCEDGKPICTLNSGCSGCRYAGNHYEPGDEFEDGCQDCVCQEGGKVNCHMRKYCNSRREVLDSFGLLRSKLGTESRSLVNGRQEAVEARATGCWADGTWYDVGDTFGGDGCTSAKCTCHWDGQVSCHQGGSECENAVGEDCWYNGGFVSHGEVVPDRNGCGTCACVDGNMVCDNSGCGVERGCWYGGSFYEQGDWFDSVQDPCKKCICAEKSTVMCTDKGVC